MALEEQVEKYKGMPISYRFGILLIVALLVNYYFYDQDNTKIESVRSTEEQKLRTAQKKLSDAKKKKAAIPKLEAEVEQVKVELGDIRRMLPVEVVIDDVLRQTQISANETGVKLSVFQPGGIIAGPSNKYFGTPVTLKLEGSYSGLASFLDTLVHFPNLIHIGQIGYTAAQGNVDNLATLSTAGRIQALKEASYIVANTTMTVYQTTRPN